MQLNSAKRYIGILVLLVLISVLSTYLFNGFSPSSYDMLVSISGAMLVFIAVFIFQVYKVNKKAAEENS